MTEEIIEVPTYEWGDLYLKFDSEAAAFDALYEPVTVSTTTYDEEGIATTVTSIVEGEFKPRYNVSLDTIGIINKPTGVMLQSDDGEIPEMAAIDGWHVNVRGPKMPELQAYAVEVNSPVRVWA